MRLWVSCDFKTYNEISFWESWKGNSNHCCPWCGCGPLWLLIIGALNKKHPKYPASSCLALGWGVLGRCHRGYFLFLWFLLMWMQYHWMPQIAEVSICCERMGRTHSKYKSRSVNQKSRSHFCCLCHHGWSKLSFSLWVNLYNSITIKKVDYYLGKCA